MLRLNKIESITIQWFLIISLRFPSTFHVMKKQRDREQVEKLSRNDEQNAFLTGKVSNVAKFSFFFIGEQKKIF
jgi:hypothetical protein